LSIRLPEELAAWLRQSAHRSGVPQGQIVREQLERARAEAVNPKAFMRHAGAFRGGPRTLSLRKGFSRD